MMRIFEFNAKKIIYLLSAVLIVTFCGSFIIPAYREYADLTGSIYQGKSKLKKYRWLISQESDFKQKAAGIQSGVDLESGKSGSLVALLQELESAASNSGVKLSEIKPQGSFGRGAPKELRIELALEGSLEGCLKFVYNIDSSILLLKIKKLRLDSKPNTQDLQARLIISQPLVLPQK